ncbi:alpha/beta fold hydrolase [Actinomadura parmotrematis]|uniref:Alpha/beta hydrolase n=1 Tax=Actinomadura parmotrematis TaxID=2864039 RepID=A0ABS7FQ56_9ACTN|nr:alpha/beta hydrolase [Actinomadura parmotrematis]MBW8481692.1 alpha/beta hydrolase [Actinomadura parmotrematis]
MPIAELPAGPVEYTDTGGPGPAVVLTHGFPMNHLQWRKVVPLLEGVRCIAPTLPLGAHRTPMRPGTDLSQIGQAAILADFLDALDLRDATLVMNDWGGAQFVVALGRTERIGRLVFVACEAFDNFPPPPARPAVLLTRAPGGVWLLMQLLRTSYFRHGRRTWGAVARSRVPDDVLDAWFEPARRSRAIRRDLRAFATGTPSRRTLLEWSEALRGFDRPALVVWAGRDAMMPREHGRRLAELLPQGRLVEIEDAGTLIPEDRPEELAGVLRGFLAETGAVPSA